MLHLSVLRLVGLAAVLAGVGGAVSLSGCGSEAPAKLDVFLPLEGMGDEALCKHLDGVIEHAYRHRRLGTRRHAAWQIIHAVIPFGRDLLIYDDQERTVRAIDYALGGGRMVGWNLEPGNNLADGRVGVRAILESGSSTGQGHKDQWLGYIAVSAALPKDTRVRVRGDHTIEDWLEQIKLDIHDGTERGWSLMALSMYYRADESWKANDNGTWSIERVMDVEAKTDFREGSCGGTHALSGMTITLLRHLEETGAKIATEGPHQGKIVDREGKVVEGGFGAANARIQEAIRLAQEYQQEDGSFSNIYFNGSQHSNDLADRLRKTGHVLEFLSLALSDEELSKGWVRRAVIHLVDVLERTDTVDLECGALYHGMSGLVLYRKRMFDKRFGALPFDEWAKEELAAGNVSEQASLR